MSMKAASFNVWVVQSVPEAKWVATSWKLTELHAVDDRDSWQVVMTLSRPLENCFQAMVVLRINRQRHVHVHAAKRIFPVSRSVITYIIKDGRARRHAFAEFFGEAVQGYLGHSQRFETVISKSNSQPAGERWYPPIIRWGYVREQSPHHFPCLCGIVDAKYYVFSFIWRRPWAQNCRLYIAHLERGNVSWRRRHPDLCFRSHCFRQVSFRWSNLKRSCVQWRSLRYVDCRRDAPAVRSKSHEVNHTESRHHSTCGVAPDPHGIDDRRLSVENFDVALVKR